MIKVIKTIALLIVLIFVSAGFTFESYRMDEPSFFILLSALIALSIIYLRNIKKIDSPAKRKSALALPFFVVIALFCIHQDMLWFDGAEDISLRTLLFVMLSVVFWFMAFGRLLDWINGEEASGHKTTQP